MTFNETNKLNFELNYSRIEYFIKLIDNPILLTLGKIFLVTAFRESDNISTKHSLTGYDITKIIQDVTLSDDKITMQKIEKLNSIRIDFSKDYDFILFKVK